jgi:hypothetical protein
MPCLKVFKRNFINMHRDITSVEGYSIMESLIPVKPKDVTSHRGKKFEIYDDPPKGCQESYLAK